MYTLLYLKWITNKNLLYSTWNSAQCYVPVGVGEGFGGEWIHVYVWLCCPLETTTTLLINYTPTQNLFGVKKRDCIIKKMNDITVKQWPI